MSQVVRIIGDNLKVSDGYHTFDELYDHRILLYINLCLAYPDKCFWTEDKDTDGWYLLYYESDRGQLSYHLPVKTLCLIEGKIKHDPEHVWDGHTSQDVVDRLTLLADNK